MTDKELIQPWESAERSLCKQTFQDYNIQHYNFTPPESRKPYDSTYKINEFDPSIFVEVKRRSEKYDEWILEVKKLNSLIKIYNQGYPVEYWCYYPGNNGYDLIVFKLTGRIREWGKTGIPIESKLMNYQTFKGNDKVIKEIVMLRYTPGVDQKFENKGWDL